jgi:hypothetical protein
MLLRIVAVYQTTRCHYPDDYNKNINSCGNLILTSDIRLLFLCGLLNIHHVKQSLSRS